MLFSNNHILYFEIAKTIIFKIISGEYVSGKKIPSVRELAASLNANPNTVMKSLDLLETEKIIYTDSTNGKYVTSDLEIIEKIKYDLACSHVEEYFESMKKLGYGIKESKELIKVKDGE